MRNCIALFVMGLLCPGLICGQSILSASTSPSIPFVTQAAISWADMDNDNDPDLLLSGVDSSGQNYTSLLRNDLNAFNPVSISGLPQVNASASDWGDFDGDGDLDFVLMGKVSTGNPLTVLYENLGSGSFSQTSFPAPHLSNGCARFADFDADGDLDIYLAGRSKLEGYIGSILRNDGGNFVELRDSIYFPDDAPCFCDVGDFDGNGYPDIVFSGTDFDHQEKTTILNNRGSFNFTTQSHFLPGLTEGSHHFADVDQDGDLDLLSCGNAPEPVLLTSHFTAGQFQPLGMGGLPVSFGTAQWGDFDNDGLVDMVTAGWSESGLFTHIYRNVGGNFVLLQSPSGLPELYAASLAFADYDNDGDLDVIVSGQTKDDIAQTFLLTYDQITQTFKL